MANDMAERKTARPQASKRRAANLGADKALIKALTASIFTMSGGFARSSVECVEELAVDLARRVAAVSAALAKGASPEAKSVGGSPALCVAARTFSMQRVVEADVGAGAKICAALIDAGADPRARDAEGLDALMLAAGASSPELARLLLTACDPAIVDADGWTALAHAVGMSFEEEPGQYGSPEIDAAALSHNARRAQTIRMIFEAWPEAARVPNKMGWTPLMHAIQVGDLESVELLAMESDWGAQCEFPSAAEGWIDASELIGLCLRQDQGRKAAVESFLLAKAVWDDGGGRDLPAKRPSLRL